ncbi:hypothetical protein [Herminiimonas sp. CN]|uniref:hypothetical protein n=1 Tax=Herminiimonas sp. CN TaxID=1349818 RepID=UPI0004734356|nr:hypothetical protein [Herminiimonas sp. CN]
MTNSEIEALATRVKMGDVWWHDGAGAIKRVRSVNLAEPAALLVNDMAVALESTSITAFVTLQPAVRPGA